MADVDELLDQACARLSEHGLDWSLRRETSPLVAADATLAVRWGETRQRFGVFVMPAIRFERVLAARNTGAPALVVAPWISARMGRRLREAGVFHLDAVGDVSLRFGPVMLEVSGRPRPPRPAASPAGIRMTRLLTPANIRVIHALLADPGLGERSIRELAAAAGVSVGHTHAATLLLAGAGYHRDRLDERQRTALRDLLGAVGCG